MQDFSHLAVKFYVEPKLNKRKTAEASRPIYDDVEMIEIRVAGDPKNVLVAPAHSASSMRDPATNARLTYAEVHYGPYEAFKKKQESMGTGTPLNILPFMTPSRVRELEALNIFTAEALAGLDGTALQRIGMGGRDLKNKAQAWLDAAAEKASGDAMAEHNKMLMDRIAQLEAMMGQGQVSQSEEPAKAIASPFQDWDDDTIRLWIEEQGGEKPHHKCGHDKLVQLADELNEKLTRATEAA